MNSTGSEDVYLEWEVVVPTISVTSATLCQGDAAKTVTATVKDAPSGFSIDWGNANITTGASATIGAIGTGLAANTYNLAARLKDASGNFIKDKSGNDVKADYTVKVNPIPAATITTVPANGEVCVGSRLEVKGNVSGASGTPTWQWEYQGAGTKNIQNLVFSSAAASLPTTYKLKVTVNGCQSPEVSKTITINQKPTVTLAAAEDSKCAGTTVQLTASSSGGSGSGYSYSWTPATLSGATPTPTLIAGNNTYSVKVTDGNNCQSDAASKTVTGYRVTVSLSANPATVHNGSSSVLTATPGGGRTPYTYEWTGITATGNTVTTPGLSAATTYKVKAVDSDRCESAEATVTVNVRGGAFAVAPKDKSICSGELPSALDAGASGGSETYKYTWTAPAGVQLSGTDVAAPQVLAASTPGTYTVEVKVEDLSSHAVKTGTLQLNIKQTPALSAVTATPAGIHPGETSQLSATVDPACTLTWSGGPLASTSGTTVNTTALSGTTTYTVEANNDGCKTQARVTVNVSGSALSIAPKNKNICSGDLPSALDAGASGGSGTYKYTWKAPAGVQLSGTTDAAPQVLATSTPGTYTVEVEVEDLSSHAVKTGTLQLKIGQTPTLSAVTATPATVYGTQTSQLSATVDPACTLTWSGGPLASTSGTTVNTTALSGTTTYTVEANNDGCKTQATVQVAVGGSALAVTPPADMPNGNIDNPFDATVSVSGGPGGYTYTWTSGNPEVTLVDKGNGTVTITSPTPGTKEICVEVVSGSETVNKCFDVLVTDPSSIGLVMTVDKKCAYPGEFLTINITGNGADTYSFVLRDKSNNEVMRVTNQATWNPYKVYTDAAGIYRITDFKYKVSGVETAGDQVPPVDAQFYTVPNVKAQVDGLANIDHCEGEMLTLKGSGDAGLDYTWDNGVADGVPFEPQTTGTTYTVTGTDPTTACIGTASVTVTLSPKPTVTVPPIQEICAGDLVTLNATGSDDVVDIKWSNNVENNVPFKPNFTADYQVTVANAAGCTATDTTQVVVNKVPEIIRHSKNPRNIAIGKDVYFAITAEGQNLTYQWKKKEGDAWVDLTDGTDSSPIIIGSTKDSISLLTVPQSWDGSEFRVVVAGDCGKDSMDFQLNVKECFEITAELLMEAGIIPDEEPGNRIDGWYCRGQEITLRTVISSEEGYDIESPHFRWIIDGLDLPEEHVELVSDTAILTWVPQFTEDDIVVKVSAYCDGACEEVEPKYLRLKAREFEDVTLKIMTDKDPEHRFCAGDTVNFWVATRNAGKTPNYKWYNDIFELPGEQSPKNELIRYDSANIVMVMGQEDTWMRVEMTPSAEICVKEPLLIDTLFMKKKPWLEPSLHIDCADTLVCRGDSVSMLAIHSNAGSNPTFQWQRSIGEPFPDWNLGTEYFATVFVDEEDMWVKCTLTPSDDICYDKTAPIVEALKISVFKDSSEVLISCDIEEKLPGDEIIFEADVKNLLGEPRFEWYVNEMKSPCVNSEYITNAVSQGDVVYCLVSGDKTCQTRIKSNEIIVNYGHINRDTILVIYKDERVKDLDMVKEGDDLAVVLFKIETPARFGVGTITTDGKFNYTPGAGFVGTDEVKYVVVNRRDKSVVAEGYIYVDVKENDRFFVPNIITPNGDGQNDVWNLGSLVTEFPNHLIQVFDRSGRIVFEARNYQNDWDGKGMTKSGYVGQINLVNGIYTYIIDLGDKNKTVLKSWIEIRANLNRSNYR